LIVFEVKGSVQNFIRAASRIQGLEFIGEEELEPEDDAEPVLYLLVPNAEGLRQIISLWARWLRDEALPRGFAPWRELFTLLSDLRPWGPQDRVSASDAEFIDEELRRSGAMGRIRLELELVFRRAEAVAAAVEGDLEREVKSRGGAIISRSRIPEIAFHALLVDVPATEVTRILEHRPESLASAEPIMFIRAQSLVTRVEISDFSDVVPAEPVPELGQPILALLDGVPVAQHPLIADRLIVDDLFDLEPITDVAHRFHGTAMASIVVRGDRNREETTLPRRVLVTPVLSGDGEEFPTDRLIVDVVYQSILHLRAGPEPIAPSILIANVSLGNRRKPFDRHISAWARLLDRMAMQFGILFVVSAGNHDAVLTVGDFNGRAEFEDADDDARSRAVVGALGSVVGYRRLLSPAETVNGLTIGALHQDSVPEAHQRVAAAVVDPFPTLSFPNCSSALGPGAQNSIKPDVLFNGSRERVIVVRTGDGIDIRASQPNRAAGIKVAAPGPHGNAEGYTGGTSAAAALASRTAHRIHDALEAAYGMRFLQLTEVSRAVLLKALLVHPAAWPPDGAELIREVLGPAAAREHVRQRDNIRRFFGYGAVDPEDAVACAADRATFWAVGELGPEELRHVDVPLPVCMTGQARVHSMTATLAWFTPVTPGQQAYRTVRLRLLDPSEQLAPLRVETVRLQPDSNQSTRGTVIHRRWEGDRAPAIARDAVTMLSVQREVDKGSRVDAPVPYGLAVTVTMPGENRIYDEVLTRVEVRPRIRA
jgi:hypothetical protein